MHPLSRIVLAARPVAARRRARRSRPLDLAPALARLEERFPDAWELPPREMDGCWLGILERPEHAFDIAVGLREAAWPAALECVLTSIATSQARRDPAALWKRALTRSQEAFAEGDGHRDWFRLELPGRSRADLELAHALARLHAAIMADWTRSRARAVLAYRRHGRQADVARELGVSQQAVSQLLQGARLKDLLRAEDAFRDWLRGSRRPGLWPLARRRDGGEGRSQPPAHPRRPSSGTR